MQHVMQILEPGGRCGIVLDEGLLYRTNGEAFVQTKRKLLDECDLWSIVSLPGGAFTGSGAGVKTNLVFSPRAARPSASGTTTCRTSRWARRRRDHAAVQTFFRTARQARHAGCRDRT